MRNLLGHISKMGVACVAMITIFTLFFNDVATKHRFRKAGLPARHKIQPEELDANFRYNKIVPKIIPYAPNDLLEAKFVVAGAEVDYGNILRVIDTVFRPRIAFNDSDDSREDDSLYTLMLVNVDGGDPHSLQWLVNNIVGDGYPTRGQETVKYDYYDFKGSTTKHLRMVFLVYRQPSKKPMNFDEEDILIDGVRGTFNITEFLVNYNLTHFPVAGNHFQLSSRSVGFPITNEWMLPFIDKWRIEYEKEQSEKGKPGLRINKLFT